MKLKELAPYCLVVKVVDVTNDNKYKEYHNVVSFKGMFFSKDISSKELNEKEIVSVTSNVLNMNSFPISQIIITVK
jgi:hypothetical protein